MFRIDEKNTRDNIDLEREIKAILGKEAKAHGIMGNEICRVMIGLTEYQKEILEDYSLYSREFDSLHYRVDFVWKDEPDNETELYIYCFEWSETGFINTNDEHVQKIVLDASGYTRMERDHLMRYGKFYIYEAYAWVDSECDWMADNWKEYIDDDESIDDVWCKLYGAYNADELLENILNDRFHPGDGRDSVEVDGVWFIVEVAL